MTRVVWAAAAMMLFATDGGWANDALLPPNLSGTWTGTGQVQKNEKSKPLNVKCTIEGKQTADTVGFAGECRALMFLKRKISAELKISGDRFTGVYVGSNAGPAQLDGTMTSPDTLTLDMTFERKVNGDDKAVMTIERPDDTHFTIKTVDRMESGVDVITSQISFTKK